MHDQLYVWAVYRLDKQVVKNWTPTKTALAFSKGCPE
jgi:hypothetical protein